MAKVVWTEKAKTVRARLIKLRLDLTGDEAQVLYDVLNTVRFLNPTYNRRRFVDSILAALGPEVSDPRIYSGGPEDLDGAADSSSIGSPFRFREQPR